MEPNFKVSIAGARKTANLTQEQFAVKLGVCRSTVVNWESGKYNPDLKHLRAIEKITGIPIDYIYLPISLPIVEQ